MYRLAPLTSRLRQRLGLSNDFRATSSRSWQIHPKQVTRVREAIFDPADLERIVGVFPTNTIAGQIALTQSGLREHGACVAHELRNAVLSKGHLFTFATAHRLALTPFPWITQAIDRHVQEAVLANSHYGIRYFGHWVTDDLPMALAACEMGHPVSVLSGPTAHQRQYLDLLALEVPVMEEARFSSIIVLDDSGQNDYKRQRASALRERIRSAITPAAGHRGLMLLRGSSGERRLLINEADVATALAQRGFAVLNPQDCDATALARACLDARIVVGVEGSQLAHGLMMMSPQGALIELQPPSRFNVTFKDRCDCEGMRYGFLVGHGQGEAFTVDVDRLHRLIDRVESSLLHDPS